MHAQLGKVKKNYLDIAISIVANLYKITTPSWQPLVQRSHPSNVTREIGGTNTECRSSWLQESELAKNVIARTLVHT